MSVQHSHNTTPFSESKHPIIVIGNQVTGPANIGGLFRLCDAFGIEKLVLDREIDLSSPRLRKTARNTFTTVNYAYVPDLTSYIPELKSKGYRILGLEITSTSTPIQTYSKGANEKIALIIGSEQHGIREDLLQLLDTCIHIEMFGTNSSMNVTQATAIALFELTKT
ncbi:MAG: hypothetical protein Aureis2KO_10410 [Aureisphaera sp.]